MDAGLSVPYFRAEDLSVHEGWDEVFPAGAQASSLFS